MHEIYIKTNAKVRDDIALSLHSIVKEWKIQAFQDIAHALDKRRPTNILVIGDSDIEILAALRFKE